MKEKLSLCVVLICMAFASHGQRAAFQASGPLTSRATFNTLDHYVAEVVYQLTFQSDSTDPEYIRQEAMILQLGPKVSLFISRRDFDSQMAVRKAETWEDMNRLVGDPNRMRSAFRFQIFHNHPEGKVTTLDRVFMDNMEYQEDLYPFSWELTGLTDSIGGYAVQQARTSYGGREWVAWFAPGLPFRAGPYKFGGLPGLILELRDTRNHYVFAFDKITAFEVPWPVEMIESRRINTTRERFWQAWQRFQDDAGNIAREFLIDPAPGTEQRIHRNMRRRNNPIEIDIY